jgi:hypothetical protein
VCRAVLPSSCLACNFGPRSTSATHILLWHQFVGILVTRAMQSRRPGKSAKLLISNFRHCPCCT